MPKCTSTCILHNMLVPYMYIESVDIVDVVSVHDVWLISVTPLSLTGRDEHKSRRT